MGPGSRGVPPSCCPGAPTVAGAVKCGTVESSPAKTVSISKTEEDSSTRPEVVHEREHVQSGSDAQSNALDSITAKPGTTCSVSAEGGSFQSRGATQMYLGETMSGWCRLLPERVLGRRHAADAGLRCAPTPWTHAWGCCQLQAALPLVLQQQAAIGTTGAPNCQAPQSQRDMRLRCTKGTPGPATALQDTRKGLRGGRFGKRVGRRVLPLLPCRFVDGGRLAEGPGLAWLWWRWADVGSRSLCWAGAVHR